MYEFLLLLNTTIWLLAVAFYIRLPYASVFHPVSYYLFFHGFIFTFRPIVLYFQNYTQLYHGYGFTPSPSDKETVILAALLGMVCFVAAALKSGNAPLRFAQDRFNEFERAELIKPFLIVATLLTPLGLVSIFANWRSRANDASTMILDTATGSIVNTTSSGYFDDAQLLLAPLAILCIWLFRFRWWSFLPLAAYIILRGGTGGRWPIMMACATVALLFLYRARKHFPNIKAAALVVLALAMFQVVGMDRGAAIRKLFVEDNSLAGVVGAQRELGFLESMDWANLEFFEYIVYAVPQRSGTYGYFLDNLQVFTEPVPRILWSGKPVGAPIKLFSLFDYGFPIGMTYSLPGEGWMQLGYLGVAFWCGLFGWFYGWIYRKFQYSRQSTLLTIAYMLFLPLSLQFFRDGLLLTLIKSHVWFLLPVLLVYWVAHFSAVPLASDMRHMALRKLAKRQPDVAAKILARQKGRGPRIRIGRGRWPAE